MWKNDLIEIRGIRKKRNRELNLGANRKEIDFFYDAVQNIFGVIIPEEYKNFLETVNGIEFNGHILYGIDESMSDNSPEQHIHGLIEMNQTWKENGFDAYLFIGEHDLSWFVYKESKGTFFELDLPLGDEIVEFSSLDDLLDRFFKRALNRG